MSKLTRGCYAQHGINFDKSTRRFLGYRYVGRATTASDENLRDTLPAPPPASGVVPGRDDDLVNMGTYRWTVRGYEKVAR